MALGTVEWRAACARTQLCSRDSRPGPGARSVVPPVGRPRGTGSGDPRAGTRAEDTPGRLFSSVPSMRRSRPGWGVAPALGEPCGMSLPAGGGWSFPRRVVTLELQLAQWGTVVMSNLSGGFKGPVSFVCADLVQPRSEMCCYCPLCKRPVPTLGRGGG